MCIGGVGPGGLKLGSRIYLLCVGYGKPPAQLGDHFEDRSLVVPHVFLVELLDVLFIDVRDDLLDADLADNLMVDKACPHGQMLLLKLEEVSALRICRDLRVDEFGIFDAAAFKVAVVGDDPHLVLDEYKREIPVVSPPRCGREEAHEICKFFS